MQVEHIPADSQIVPIIGAGQMTREQAHQEVLALLELAAELNPALRALGEVWKRGAKDDTVYHDRFIWTIYPHPDYAGPGPEPSVSWTSEGESAGPAPSDSTEVSTDSTNAPPAIPTDSSGLMAHRFSRPSPIAQNRIRA